MKRLNNRGITTIEILICFILLAVISTSLYNTVSIYRNKQILEREKEKIYTYTNLLTKEIQDDIIKKGLNNVTFSGNLGAEFTFADSTNKTLSVDDNKITYGDISYPYPNFGKNASGKKVFDITGSEVGFSGHGGCFVINVRLKHPDFGDKYGIHIVAPINYTS